jgi:hypothetical protein
MGYYVQIDQFSGGMWALVTIAPGTLVSHAKRINPDISSVETHSSTVVLAGLNLNQFSLFESLGADRSR